jgi:hypothetical protein
MAFRGQENRKRIWARVFQEHGLGFPCTSLDDSIDHEIVGYV